MVERAGSTLTVDSSVRMLHVCLQIGHDKQPKSVAITNNPLEYDRNRIFAQMVMYKSKSHNCCVQVARYVRRTYDIGDATVVHRSGRFVEAKIGYVCLNGYQYGPENVSEEHLKVVGHIAATSIKQLLEEVKNGINAARTRYVVYEVRELGGAKRRWRAVSNKMHSVLRVWATAPADTVERPDIVHVGKFDSMELAQAACGEFPKPEGLWTRSPAAQYLRPIIRIEGDEIVFVADGSTAVRPYDSQVSGPVVVIGPHTYMATHVRYCLERGEWFDGQIRKAPAGSLLFYPNK